MKRKGKEESQLTTLSKDVSTVLDDEPLKVLSATTHDRVTELKENTLDEIKAMSKKLDAILKKVDRSNLVKKAKKSDVSGILCKYIILKHMRRFNIASI